MRSLLLAIGTDGAADLRARILAISAILIGANVLAWAWAVAAFGSSPVLLGTAFLAYGFGLRHAVDADHIAAIDNVTRKLVQEGKRPVAVGFYFALGHSTVVILLSVGIATAAGVLQDRFAGLRSVGAVVGTSLSAFFLIAIAIANLFVLAGVHRSFQRVRRGGRYVEEDLDLLFARGGLIARLVRPLFRAIGQSWHMYPLGFLFGLGFETASEIGLLGIAAAAGSKAMPAWAILVFPALFTVGMTLIDTADGILMLGAYGWAFVKPIRKLYYNMVVTFVSVLVALVVGGIEALGLAVDQLKLSGRFWDAVGALNDDFGSLGYVIVGVFALSWLVSAAIYRLRRYDEIGPDIARR